MTLDSSMDLSTIDLSEFFEKKVTIVTRDGSTRTGTLTEIDLENRRVFITLLDSEKSRGIDLAFIRMINEVPETEISDNVK